GLVNSLRSCASLLAATLILYGTTGLRCRVGRNQQCVRSCSPHCSSFNHAVPDRSIATPSNHMNFLS
ncbi:MAG: hypothetical protein ACQ9MH_21470, partial [Nitrospinales bacterium]